MTTPDPIPTAPDPLVPLLRMVLKQQCQHYIYQETDQFLAIDGIINVPLLATALRGALIGSGVLVLGPAKAGDVLTQRPTE